MEVHTELKIKHDPYQNVQNVQIGQPNLQVFSIPGMVGMKVRTFGTFEGFVTFEGFPAPSNICHHTHFRFVHVQQIYYGNEHTRTA